MTSPLRATAAPARRTAPALAAVLGLGLGLAGCTVGPDYATPDVKLSARWASVSDRKPTPVGSAELGVWWRGFDDPVLDGLVEEAIAGNLDVAQARARVEQARATRRETVATLLPSLDGSGSATRSRTPTGTDTPPVVASAFKAGFDATWELDLFGANARSAEAATRGLEASEEDLRKTLLTLVGDVASNYAEARGYQARIALARRTAASQRITAELTRLKLEIGTIATADAAKADASAASTEANIPGFEASFAQAVHRLGVLVGREPTALAERMRRSAPVPALRRPIPSGVPADVLRNRPDVRAAERRLAQATANIGAAEAALYPSVSLTGSLSTTATRVGDIGHGSTIGWSWGPSVSVPIFEGGKLVAARDLAVANRNEYLGAWRSAVLGALEDVENALVSLAKEREKAAKLRAVVDSYRTAAEIARDLYRNGKTSFLDVQDAERSLYSAEDSLIQSRVAVATDTIALAKALGGGWDQPAAPR